MASYVFTPIGTRCAATPRFEKIVAWLTPKPADK